MSTISCASLQLSSSYILMKSVFRTYIVRIYNIYSQCSCDLTELISLCNAFCVNINLHRLHIYLGLHLYTD